MHRLLAAATAHEDHFIWGAMLCPFMLVLYCTGLRLGEAARLQQSDADLEHGTLMIRHSKGRSQIVPIRADLAAELRRYVEARQQRVEVARRSDPTAFFLRKDASPLSLRSASQILRRLLRQLAMKPPSGRSGARPYEFRHFFAVHRLTAWAVARVDVQARLPWLSAYLGH